MAKIPDEILKRIEEKAREYASRDIIVHYPALDYVAGASFGYQLAQEEWIDVRERLPDEGGRYLCYCESVGELGKSNFQWNCAYDPITKTFHDFAYSFKDGERVTHWQPLPSPPKIDNQIK